MRFILLSMAVTPPIMFLLLFFNITDQPDGRTKEEAQTYVLKKLFQYPLFWIWVMYMCFMLFIFSKS